MYVRVHVVVGVGWCLGCSVGDPLRFPAYHSFRRSLSYEYEDAPFIPSLSYEYESSVGDWLGPHRNDFHIGVPDGTFISRFGLIGFGRLPCLLVSLSTGN